MTYIPNPSTNRTGEFESRSTDDSNNDVLLAILKQLKIMNIYLSQMTDIEIRNEEVH